MLTVKKCSACNRDFAPEEKLVFCALCQNIYHYQCWQEKGGCITPGCQGQPVLGQAVAEEVQSLQEEEQKKEPALTYFCPVCQGKIADKVHKCPHCESIIKKRGYKEPIAACLFNLLLLGAGYIYLGHYKKAFLWLLIGVVAALITWGGIGGFIVLAWVMYDSYQMADKMNKGEL